MSDIDLKELCESFSDSMNECAPMLRYELLSKLNADDFETIRVINNSCDYDTDMALPIYSVLICQNDYINAIEDDIEEDVLNEVTDALELYRDFSNHVAKICEGDNVKQTALLVTLVQLCEQRF